jgi:PAS domain S-box-containing protein
MSQSALTLSREGVILYGNRCFAETLGRPSSDVIGRSLAFFLPPDERESLARTLHDARTAPAHRPMHLVDFTGHLIPVNLSATFVVDEEMPEIFCVVLTNLEQFVEAERLARAILEERVLERTAELEQSVREMEAFTYTVSHDLRAPLRAIDGYAAILSARGAAELSSETNEMIRLVRTNAQEMAALIDDLLDFSRVGREPLKHEPIWPATLVRACLETLRGELEGRDISFVMRDLPPSSGDPGLLKVVWMNLLSNAIKYTRGKTPARIEIGSTVERETVYFVRDNGVGFHMKYASNLFRVFHRLHRAEDYEGTGVGLATVKRIVERHGGRVWVESTLGEGSTFYFTLGGGPS